MNRRFGVPGMQKPRLPHQRTQRLPDDLNDFIATGRVLSQRQPPVAAPVSIPSDSPADPMLLSSIAPAAPESPASAAPHPAINPVASFQDAQPYRRCGRNLQHSPLRETHPRTHRLIRTFRPLGRCLIQFPSRLTRPKQDQRRGSRWRICRFSIEISSRSANFQASRTSRCVPPR